ncbi:putative membrane protein [Anaerovibrio sp. JC8]|uniref:ATP-grasp domain-containing protein n=1 Tax=Anaerovibrio sp. JC8 TaxID=1240085 RepID=UPI000A0C018E|nr:ATP-grasp domain-containing protein [Anaerovibrio sp. JC8]ORT99393.1 putative membrane protein [Anaerovibrio sp. JC8]
MESIYDKKKQRLSIVLFPSDYFNPSVVDGDFENEYRAVLEQPNLMPLIFSYEGWFQQGKMILSGDLPKTASKAVYRGWMMQPEKYAQFYEALKERNILLTTSPEEYGRLHVFPNAYPYVKEDSARILCFKLHEPIQISSVLKEFPWFMVKDFVKSVKGSDFPKFFDSSFSQEDFDHWMEVFYKYRGDLLTGGICIKEYLNLKKYDGKTNEYRAFYANNEMISFEPNSGQGTFTPAPPAQMLKKYQSVESPFYTVDYAELADGSWKVIETGDGSVSGLSDRQDVRAFYRSLYLAFS